MRLSAHRERAEKCPGRFLPVKVGDVLKDESEIIEVRPSKSRTDRGLVTVRSETSNQRGEVVQILTASFVVFRRPEPSRLKFHGVAGL